MTRLKHGKLAQLIGVASLLLSAGAFARPVSPDPLREGFADPPQTARPRVWWHWMNGNVTKEGIKLDLEWMKRIGLGGFQNFDASLGTPQVVDKRLVFMTPEWKDAFNYAVTLADQLGLEMAIAGSPGWSESGGPWVKPADGMKKLVWSETRLEGGKRFSGKLPRPPVATGRFQDLPQREFSYKPDPSPKHYSDAAVIAFRIPGQETPQAELAPTITSSAGPIDIARLTDGLLADTNDLPKGPVGREAWIKFDFRKPARIHAITLSVKRPYDPHEDWQPLPASGHELQASDDGTHWKLVASIPYSRVDQRIFAFPATTARFFRVVFRAVPTPEPSNGGRDWGGMLIPRPDLHQVAELVLHTGPRVHFFEEKAAYAATTVPLAPIQTPSDGDHAAIRKVDVVDLTSRFGPDERLDWTPPPGRWVVLRLGASLTGKINHPASPEGTGLEVDKLDETAVRNYFNTYLDLYKSASGPLMGKRGLQYIIQDSWEAGFSNWTPSLVSEFTRLRGYSPIPYLPVLTGRVVESAAASDRFLWDYRQTLSDLVVKNHYDQVTDLLRERGMGRYTEAHETGRALLADGMDIKRRADVPMSAIWTSAPGEDPENIGASVDIRESASVAHIYGQNLVAAESLTTGAHAWAWAPELLKPTADKALALGLNRFVIHTSVHQPSVDRAPGLTLGQFGQWFTRHETWSGLAKPWIDYLARSSFMLQQGRFVGDVLYFYGEDTNLTALFAERLPSVPAGYNYDFANASVIVHELAVREDALETRSGGRYRLLALDPNTTRMSLPVLRRIRDLVAAGASVVGPKPIATPSLVDDAAEFKRIADALWPGGAAVHAFGKGRVFQDLPIAEALRSMNVAPDLATPEGSKLLFVHRQLADGDAYYVASRSRAAQRVDASFRVSGMEPELWRADTGRTEPASFSIEGGRTTVPLRLDPYETVFVVFRKSSGQTRREVAEPIERPLLTVTGPWAVEFQAGRGAPAAVAVPELASWSDSSDPGVRYFSGTGTYRKEITADAAWLKKGRRVMLDLGSVKNLAEVRVNGKAMGILWKAPFTIDITKALRPGRNAIEIGVTNLWVNRLIGDQQPGATKYSFTTERPYTAESPLLPSGLLGPVRLIQSVQNVKAAD